MKSFVSIIAIIAVGLVASTATATASHRHHSEWIERTAEYSGEKPGPRFLHTFGLSEDGTSMLVFGGRQAGWHDYYGDTFVLDTVRKEWVNLGVMDPSPSPRFGAWGFTYHGGFYLFGGLIYKDNNNTAADGETLVEYNDLWRFDFAARTWELIPTTNTPKPRGLHLFNIVNDTGVLFGGKFGCHKNRVKCPVTEWNNEDVYNDTWTLDLKTMKWEQVMTPVAPFPRYETASFVYNGQLHTFGGRTYPTKDCELKNDIWRFDFDRNTWVEVTPVSNSPLPHVRNAVSAVPFGSMFYITHGAATCDDAWLDDTWCFDFTFGTWRRIISPVFPRQREAFQALNFNGKYFMFGGKDLHRIGEEIAFNDIWTFDL